MNINIMGFEPFWYAVHLCDKCVNSLLPESISNAPIKTLTLKSSPYISWRTGNVPNHDIIQETLIQTLIQDISQFSEERANEVLLIMKTLKLSYMVSV